MPDALHAEAGRLQGPARGHPVRLPRDDRRPGPAARAHHRAERRTRTSGPTAWTASPPPPGRSSSCYGHEDRLRVEHPDCGHDFPPEMRETAYKLFDAVLAIGPKPCPLVLTVRPPHGGRRQSEPGASHDPRPQNPQGQVSAPEAAAVILA